MNNGTFDFNLFLKESKETLLNPKSYFSTMKISGGMIEPLIKAVIYGAIAGVIYFLWGILGLGSAVGGLFGGAVGIMLFIWAFIAAVIGMFIGGVVLLIISSICKGNTDFEANVRVTAALMVVVPISALFGFTMGINFSLGLIISLVIKLYGLWLLYHGLVEALKGKKYSFDEEAKAYYDVEPPAFPEEHFKKLVADLGSLVPGEGPIPERVEHYRRQFTVTPDRMDRVFNSAINECRLRTKKYITLPENETFRLEYVHNKSWSGYNWYKGNNTSLIQINTDLPIFLERAIDLAAHEGYPGHHVYNSLLETAFVRNFGWVEFTVYPLFSSQSLIAEGTANFGIEVAFPGKQRMEFERDVLFPLAGLNSNKAEDYSKVQILAAKLSYAGNEAARRYLNGEISREDAIQWLVNYALMSPERASQRTRFFDQYRSYVINYNLGYDMVRQYIERRGGTEDKPGKRWEEFTRLISSPRLPSGLV